jgi:peroxiredoxin
MKLMILALATFFAVTTILPVSGRAQTEDKLKPGDDLPASEVSMKNANGKSTTLKAATGKNGLLVMFSCNTCPFVVKNQPATKKTMEYATSHNIGMVIINSNESKRDAVDSYQEMKKYAKEQGYTVPYVVDESSKVADLFGANHTPEVFLFNNKGKLMYKGAINDNPSNPESYKKAYVEDAIDAIIAGKEVNPKTTKSIGCSIKRKA